MRRREFITGLGGAASLLFTGATPAAAQTPNRVYRLGHLTNSAPSEILSRSIILPELARLGFIEGRNLVFDGRVGEVAALPALAGELLAAKADAIIAIGDFALVAAGAATQSVPIVSFGADPIQHKLAASYARPGGNVTGVTILVAELEAKRLSILREAVPERRRIAALVSTSNREISEPLMRKVAEGLGVELLVFPVAAAAEYPAAFAAMRAAGAQALLIGAAAELFRDGKQLAALALEARLPTVCEWAQMAQDGCLLGYGPNRVALRKRTAGQVAQIFRGAAPGDVAIELPTLFEFAINRKTAAALDLTLPPLLLAQADEVIE
jgi:putative tryptophan/tyrosine transport system substrate-binding protein